MTVPEINFHLETEDFTLEKEDERARWLMDVCQKEEKELAVLNYIFCSDEYLLDINRKYLDHDYYTDIISFPLKKDPIEGDIFISVDRVRENALKYGVAFDLELARVMVHGLLHFMGYDDHSEEDVKIMREKENEYIKNLE
jgi:probable rRNA maturation factor